MCSGLWGSQIQQSSPLKTKTAGHLWKLQPWLLNTTRKTDLNVAYSTGLGPYSNTRTSVPVEFPGGLQLTHWLYILLFPSLSSGTLWLEVAIGQILYNAKLPTCLYFWVLQAPTFSTALLFSTSSFSLLIHSLI